MGFLEARRAPRRDVQQKIGESAELPAAFTGESDRQHFFLPGRFESLDDVRRSPARGKGQGDVAFVSEGFHLTAEHEIVGGIVGDRGQRRRVGRESDGPQGFPRPGELVHQLGRQVLGLGGAPTISEDKELMTRL